MRNIVIAVILSSGAGVVAASWYFFAGPPMPGAVEKNDAPSIDASQPVLDRIAALERAIGDERLARQILQEEVFVLTEQLENLRAGSRPESRRIEEAQQDSGPGISAEDRRRMFALRSSTEGRAERLVAAGFLPSQAEWIVQREQELQMAALQARYEAGQNGSPADFFREQISAGSALREELGDADYERYLEANGRPTSVVISSVIGSSPAESAGLQPGDQIVRYDGERVFSMTDINLSSMDGQAGQNIVVDIVRDGVPMQVVMPRGPLGVTGGRNRR